MASNYQSRAGAVLQLDMADEAVGAEPPARPKLAMSGGRTPSRAGGGDKSGYRAGRTGSPVAIDPYIVPGTGGHGRARADGLLAVAQAFGCRIAVYGYDATRNDKFLVMT